MMAKKKKNKGLDWATLVAVLILVVSSLVAVYSTSYSSEVTYIQDNFSKQILWILFGLVVLFVVAYIPGEWLYSTAWFWYVFLMILLILLFAGFGSGSTNRWFQLGSIRFQPSEFVKPVLILALSHYLSDDQRQLTTRTLAVVFAIVFLPFVLVIRQPDLGTSLTFLVIVLPMLYWRGLSPFIIFVICAPFLTFIASFNYWTFFFSVLVITIILYISQRGWLIYWSVFLVNILVGIAAPQIWNHLHEYQKKRIFTFLGLVSDPRGAGYQIIQSKVAVGSGGFLGKGFTQGSQTQLRFLPAQHTDFIFSVIAEEWGFVGAMVVLLAFFVLLMRAVFIASVSRSMFSSLAVIGVTSVLAFQIVVNIGMAVGIMPVTGLPLPFVSYGGSSMISSFIMLGILLNSYRTRFNQWR